ncbi:hypothetical protein DV735_g4228, partial [Chaetothyriales sp. CBS 134920]
MLPKRASRKQAPLYAVTAEEPHYPLHASLPAFARGGSLIVMADGRNEARAMRVLEIMNDFRTVQHHLESLVGRQESSPPDQESYYLDGYVLMRQCETESRAVLAANFNPGTYGINTGEVPETEMRSQVLRGSNPNGDNAQALRRIDQNLREELSDITDDHVYSDLRRADRQKGYWLDEDPSLSRILSWTRMQR